MPPLASPGNIDWRLITPQQQAIGIGAWVPVIKPGNSAWLYVFAVGGGAGGSGGATRASGVAGAGGGGGAGGGRTIAIIPWATLPDIIYACPGLGGAGGAANLSSGSGGNLTGVSVEPVAPGFNDTYKVFITSAGQPPSGATGGSASAGYNSGFTFGNGIITGSNSNGGTNGGATSSGSNMGALIACQFAGGAGGAGTTTGNVSAAGGGLFSVYNAGPGQIIGSTSGGGEGGGAAGGGAGAHGRQLGQGSSSPLDLFLLTGNSRPIMFLGGCGGGSNGAGTGGKGGDGDWGAGGGGGGAGITGGVGGKGGDGFIIIGNF